MHKSIVKCAQSARSACFVQRSDAYEYFFSFHFMTVLSFIRFNQTYSNRNTIVIMEPSVHRLQGFSIVRLVNIDFHSFNFMFLCMFTIYFTLSTTICHLHNGKMKMNKKKKTKQIAMDL